jgi:hypothetical protein
MGGLGLGAAVLNLMPNSLLVAITKRCRNREDEQAGPGDATMRALAVSPHTGEV